MFFKHADKHELANDNYEVFLGMLLQLYYQIDEANKLTFSEEYFKELLKTEPCEAENQKFTLNAFESQFKRIKNFNIEKSRPTINKWWQEADKNKIAGFYVDFKNKAWLNPDRINKENYELSKFLTWNLVLLIQMVDRTGAMLK
jgi:hypothetical protein